MDKKDIYEHLAHIYLDASTKHKRKKKARGYRPLLRGFSVSISAIVFILCVGFLAEFKSGRSWKPSEVALLLQCEAAKINFNFDPAKKEAYALDISRLDLNKFKRLGFAVRKTNNRDTISLKVELTNRFKEKSSIYIRDIPSKWHDYVLSLAEFKGISHWQEMSSLAFIIEEWNAKEKRGIVYLDNIRLLR